METIVIGSDAVRGNWAAMVDEALQGTRVRVQRNKRSVVSVVNDRWLDDVLKMAGIMERQLAEARRASQEMVDDPSIIVHEEEYQRILAEAGIDE